MQTKQGYTRCGFSKERDITYRESSVLFGLINTKKIISTVDMGVILHIRTDETKFSDVFINGKRYVEAD